MPRSTRDDAGVFGLFAITRAALPVMRAQNSGHVIDMTSVAGFAASAYDFASKPWRDNGSAMDSDEAGRPRRARRMEPLTWHTRQANVRQSLDAKKMA